MFYIEKQLNDFAAAHRLINGYVGECKNLHGHNYSVTVEFASTTLDSCGILIDFSDIKAVCDTWIKNNLDHSVLINAEDLDLLNFVRTHQQKYFIVPGNNTTAECLALFLFQTFETEIEKYFNGKNKNKIMLTSVEVAESKRSRAIYKK